MKTKKKYNIIFFIGIIMIYSFFNMYSAKFINPVYDNHLIKQIIWYTLGFIIIFIINKLNIKKLFSLSLYLYLFSLITLILVLFIGSEINGSKAWFNIGPISLQPSEFMKITLALYLCDITNKFNEQKKKNENKYIIQMLIVTIIPSFLVFIEPDTGAIIFYLIILVTCIINSKINKKWFVFGSILLLIVTVIFTYLYWFNQNILISTIGTSFFYRIDRIINFSDNYQLNNALTLIGSSGFFGSKINESLLYVPEAPTDFIFALNSGNFGLFGNIIILLSYFFINFIILKSIKKANNKLFVIIFISLFIFQQSYNILMNIGLLPIMGIPLPFLSYGGSSLLVYFFFLAIYFKLI